MSRRKLEETSFLVGFGNKGADNGVGFWLWEQGRLGLPANKSWAEGQFNLTFIGRENVRLDELAFRVFSIGTERGGIKNKIFLLCVRNTVELQPNNILSFSMEC